MKFLDFQAFVARLLVKFGAEVRTAPRKIFVPAIIIVLPLAAFAFLTLGWLDADDASSRQIMMQRARDKAQRIEAAALAALDGQVRDAFHRVEAARSDDDPGRLRQLLYFGDISYILIRRNGQLLFPHPQDFPLAKVEEERLHLLSASADLHSQAEPPQGWYSTGYGEVFFRCLHKGDEEICVALDESMLHAKLAAALSGAIKAVQLGDARLRDPYDRIFGGGAPGFLPDFFSFPLSGGLQGWTLDISDTSRLRASPARIAALVAPLALFWLYFVGSTIRRQSESLRQAESKKAFLAKIAHDLRTPLTNLNLYCELVAQQSAQDEQARHYCAVMADEIGRLDQLSSNAMTFGQKRAPQLREAIPDVLVKRLVESFDLRFSAYETHCVIEESEAAPLLFDVAAFERILVNLLDNVCKYAPGAVTVGTHFSAGVLQLDVQDHGPGLAAKAQPPLSGLGLTIVRDLAEANGGFVSLDNRRDGLHVVVTMQAKLA